MIPEPIGAEGQPLDEQKRPLEHAPAAPHTNQDEPSGVGPEPVGLTDQKSAEPVEVRPSVSADSTGTPSGQVPTGHLPDDVPSQRVGGPEREAADAPRGPLESHSEPGYASQGLAEQGPHGEQTGIVPDSSEGQELSESEEEEEEEEEFEDVEPLEEEVVQLVDEGDIQKEWYILKVQSNREQSICDGLQRRVAIAGLERYFGDVIVPTEDVAEFKNGKRRIVKRKLYPGYIVVNMAINDETWFLVRETPGIGDFTGSAGRPTPMLPHEVDRIVKSGKSEDEGGEPIKTAIPFKQGDRVRIKDGTFENFEGDVEGIDEANGRVTVMINIFGRSTPVELEHWQIDAV